MSRTYKDKKWELRFPEEERYISTGRYTRIKLPGTKTKKKRSHDKWHGLRGTPSWWTNMFMNRPIRRNFQAYERNVVKSNVEYIDNIVVPNNGKKPHKYYW